MKGFAHLVLLTGAIAQLACSEAGEAPSPLPAAPPAAPVAEDEPEATPAEAVPDPAKGKLLYATFCASCHGPRGEGDGALAGSLQPKPAKHSDAAYMNALSDEYLFEVVKRGGPAVGKSPAMAPWGGTLSDPQIRDVVAFMRTLAN